MTAPETAGPQSIEEALAIFQKPDDQLPALPKLRPAARLFADTRAHRLLPDRLAMSLTDLATDVRWRRSQDLREYAHTCMRYLLGRSERAHEVPQLAKRYAQMEARRREFLWRPWMAGRIPFENREALEDAKSLGRGVCLNFMHHGPYVALTQTVDRAGTHPYAAIAPFYFEEPQPGYNGHHDRRHMRTLRAGATVFNAAGSFPLVLAILQDGRAMGLSTDVPGSAEMTFLGRRVRAASGCTKASLRTGAPIVPIALYPDKRTIAKVRFLDPIDPQDFPSVEALQQEIATRHEPAVLAWPEAFEWPLQRWTPADPAECEEFGFPAPA